MTILKNKHGVFLFVDGRVITLLKYDYGKNL